MEACSLRQWPALGGVWWPGSSSQLCCTSEESKAPSGRCTAPPQPLLNYSLGINAFDKSSLLCMNYPQSSADYVFVFFFFPKFIFHLQIDQQLQSVQAGSVWAPSQACSRSRHPTRAEFRAASLSLAGQHTPVGHQTGRRKGVRQELCPKNLIWVQNSLCPINVSFPRGFRAKDWVRGAALHLHTHVSGASIAHISPISQDRQNTQLSLIHSLPQTYPYSPALSSKSLQFPNCSLNIWD